MDRQTTTTVVSFCKMQFVARRQIDLHIEGFLQAQVALPINGTAVCHVTTVTAQPWVWGWRTRGHVNFLLQHACLPLNKGASMQDGEMKQGPPYFASTVTPTPLYLLLWGVGGDLGSLRGAVDLRTIMYDATGYDPLTKSLKIF